ncbi:hypothetical protein EVAR_55660_1 [Eumeta japonica]|uniref:Uncharacterized protein n=1 Tax=Eumeta variegata TaxID=151549 RepID=A0A4C1Y1U6_EUMVA|nr:hypothetical protein EVAR_55660_1 [Eumeta japonica]
MRACGEKSRKNTGRIHYIISLKKHDGRVIGSSKPEVALGRSSLAFRTFQMESWRKTRHYRALPARAATTACAQAPPTAFASVIASVGLIGPSMTP